MSDINPIDEAIFTDYIVGAFGKIYPKNYRYKISTEWELAEVEWLISEGDFESIEEYEISITRLLLNQP